MRPPLNSEESFTGKHSFDLEVNQYSPTLLWKKVDCLIGLLQDRLLLFIHVVAILLIKWVCLLHYMEVTRHILKCLFHCQIHGYLYALQNKYIWKRPYTILQSPFLILKIDELNKVKTQYMKSHPPVVNTFLVYSADFSDIPFHISQNTSHSFVIVCFGRGAEWWYDISSEPFYMWKRSHPITQTTFACFC